MIQLINIEKRRELASMVYAGYETYNMKLTDDEKREFANEVGAAFKGYSMAMENVIRKIVDGCTMEELKDCIVKLVNGEKKHKSFFSFPTFLSTELKKSIYTTVKKELIRNGKNEETAQAICDAFVNNPQSREDIIEKNDLQSIRICEHCGKPMREGYLVYDYHTYCCDTCVKEDCGWTEDDFEENIFHAEENDAPIFWTEWNG